jgi:membrane fusion protein, adhesin transport system
MNTPANKASPNANAKEAPLTHHDLMEDEELLDTKNTPGAAVGNINWLIITTLSMTVIYLLVWSSIGVLDIITVTEGEVVPSSSIKSIQHLEGGIVRAIAVREGEIVSKGQLLVELESTSRGADVNELKSRLIGLEVELIRLKAQSKWQKKLVFPDRIASKHPKLIRDAKRFFQVRRQRLDNEVAEMRENIAERKGEKREIIARLSSNRKNYKLLQEQLEISKDLLKDQLVSRLKHLSLLREDNKLQSSIQEDSAAIDRVNAMIRKIELEIGGVKAQYVEEAQGESEKKTQSFKELTYRIRKYDDSLSRTILRAPEKGIVKSINVSTIGGVIRAGETVLDIVPVDGTLIIEGSLSPQDIGHVRPGQGGFIKLASSEAIRYGKLDVEVIHISPDTIEDSPDGMPYYKVRLKTERDYFESGGRVYHLVPGVQVSVSIRTGERHVLDYFLEPFLMGMDNALKER